MMIIRLIFFSILLFEPIASFDVIQILDYFIFGSSSIRRKIYLNTNAENKFIQEQDFIKTSIRDLQRDIEKMSWDIEKWKDYHRNCNIFMYFVVNWILKALQKRTAKKNERLTELLLRQSTELFCDQHQDQHFDSYHPHWNSICEIAFEDDFVKKRKWTLHPVENTSCEYIDVYSINPTQPTNFRQKIIFNRLVRRCVAQHEETHLNFDIYLISSINYKPNTNPNYFSYFVVVEHILRGKPSNDPFHNVLSNENNNDRKEIAAYIEK